MAKKIDDTFDEAWSVLLRLGLNYYQAYRAWQVITGHLDKDGWFRKRPAKPTHHLPTTPLNSKRPLDDNVVKWSPPENIIEIPVGCGSMPSTFESYEDFEAYAEETYREHPDDETRQAEWYRQEQRESEERYRRRREARVNNQDQGKKDHISTGELLGAEAKRQRGESKVGQEVAGQGSCGKAGQRGRVEKLHKHPIVPPGEETPESQRAALRRKKRGGQW